MNFPSFRGASDAQIKKFEKNLKQVRLQAGLTAVKHFKQSFRNEGFTDETISKWDNVQRRIPGTLAYEVSKGAGRTRGILRGKGILANSVRVLQSSGYKVTIGVAGLKYAAVHNEGATFTRNRIFGRKAKQPFPVKIPQRQFIGNSKLLERDITTKLLKAWAQS